MPASMPRQDLGESSAGPGRCVRAFNAGKGRAPEKKIKKASELFLFILYASPGFNSPSASSSSQKHTRVYRPRKPGGDTKSATKIVAGMKYSAVRPLSLSPSLPPSSPLFAVTSRGVMSVGRPEFPTAASSGPNGSWRYGTVRHALPKCRL